MRRTPHIPRPARLAGLLTSALLAFAAPALAASPVSDQYLSAPAAGTATPPAAAQPAPGTQAQPSAPQAIPGTTPGANPGAAKKAVKPLKVDGSAGAGVQEPLAASGSDLPLAALGGLGLLLLALACAAIGRARRSAATS